MNRGALRAQQMEAALRILRTEGEYPQYVLPFEKPPCDFTNVSSLKSLKGKLNARAVAELIVEVSYFLFVAYTNSIPVDITQKSIYVLSEELENQKCALSFYVLYWIGEQGAPNTQLKDAIEGIIRYAQLEQSRELRDFILQYRSINLSKFPDNIEILMSCLELTELFRKNSTSLRFQNLSMIAHVRSSKEHMKAITNCLSHETELIQSYEVAKLNNTSEEEIQKIEIRIEQNAKGFLMEELGNSVIVEDTPPTEGNDTYELCFNLKFRERTFSLTKELSELTKTESSQTEYMNPEYESVEYFIMYSSERASLNVELYTNIELSKDISDFVTMQTNQLGFHSANVTLEVCEKNSISGTKARYLTFKTYSCFVYKEPIVEKMLLIMDTLLIAKLIFEPYFKEAAEFKIDRDTREIHRKIDHYQVILNKMLDSLINRAKERP